MTLRNLIASLIIVLALVGTASAQNFAGVPAAVPAQQATPFYTPIPISATTAVGNPTTLTVPAPATGLYNYVCYLALETSVGAGGTVATNATTSTTNFNSFATKLSNPGTANTDQLTTYFNVGPGSGCVKSASPATSTTFVSPTTAAIAYSWYATYYQAP